MASHIAIDVADAVIASLNAGSFTPAVTAERTYTPERDLEELADMAVFVIPGAMTIEKETRTLNAYTIRIDVVILKKNISDSNAVLDEYMDLTMEIMEHFDRKDLTAGALAVKWMNVENELMYDPARLQNERLFLARVSFSYLVVT